MLQAGNNIPICSQQHILYHQILQGASVLQAFNYVKSCRERTHDNKVLLEVQSASRQQQGPAADDNTIPQIPTQECVLQAGNNIPNCSQQHILYHQILQGASVLQAFNYVKSCRERTHDNKVLLEVQSASRQQQGPAADDNTIPQIPTQECVLQAGNNIPNCSQQHILYHQILQGASVLQAPNYVKSCRERTHDNKVLLEVQSASRQQQGPAADDNTIPQIPTQECVLQAGNKIPNCSQQHILYHQILQGASVLQAFNYVKSCRERTHGNKVLLVVQSASRQQQGPAADDNTIPQIPTQECVLQAGNNIPNCSQQHILYHQILQGASVLQAFNYVKSCRERTHDNKVLLEVQSASRQQQGPAADDNTIPQIPTQECVLQAGNNIPNCSQQHILYHQILQGASVLQASTT